MGVSIETGVFQRAYEQREWVYNDNCELLFISEGTGQRIVGDTMKRFQPGDLVFLGSRLPNIWVSDPIKLDPGSDRQVESIYIRFDPELLAGPLYDLPEFEYVRSAFKRSERGCDILGDSRNKISELMMQVPYLEGFEQIVNLLNILNLIGKSDEVDYLTSVDYSKSNRFKVSQRVHKLHEYLIRHYQKPLDLDGLSSLVNMQTASLCRFYKKETGNTISEYLNQMRIDFASKMLMNRHLRIEEIAFECGFNTISFFNRQFKKYKKVSPSEYRKRFSGIDAA